MGCCSRLNRWLTDGGEGRRRESGHTDRTLLEVCTARPREPMSATSEPASVRARIPARMWQSRSSFPFPFPSHSHPSQATSNPAEQAMAQPLCAINFIRLTPMSHAPPGNIACTSSAPAPSTSRLHGARQIRQAADARTVRNARNVRNAQERQGSPATLLRCCSAEANQKRRRIGGAYRGGCPSVTEPD